VDLLHLVGARGVVCYGPYREGEPTFVRADAWIPQWRDVLQKEAENMLLRKYLKAYGPATVKDFAWWTGITLTEAREIWARQHTDFVSVEVDGWEAAVLREDLDELEGAVFERPHVRLLPYFDSFLLGHKDRKHLVAEKYHSEVYRSQGWIAPVVLVDGRVAAVWKQVQERKRLRVELTRFGPLLRRVAARIREDAQNLGRFLGVTDVDLQFD
jgi:uncharacterized protein YcaQ